MLKISNNSLNGIVLGQKKADFDDVTLNDPSYSLEFDRKHKIQSDSQLITVSSSGSCNEFSLDGKIINFFNLEKFLRVLIAKTSLSFTAVLIKSTDPEME